MKLIQPKVEILDKIDGQEILERIEQVARTCYKSEPKYGYEYMTDNGINVVVQDTAVEQFNESETTEILPPHGKKINISAKNFVKRLIESKHEAMLEFVDITVKFTCDRITSQSIVRHRLASFAQESTRYCNYSKDKFGNELTFIIPSWLDWKEETISKGDFEKFGSGSIDSQLFINSLLNAEDSYLRLIKEGWKPQQARMVLPMSIKTEINMKCNLREWRHFFKLRCSTAAHPDIRKLALDLLNQMHEQIPVIFDDLYEEFLNK